MVKTKVDFSFIKLFEGGCQVEGYVPDPLHSKSGVTIASGFDIGQCQVEALSQRLPESLVNKLAPYCGLKQQAAVDKLTALPLAITRVEANLIDICVVREVTDNLIKQYRQDSGQGFETLLPAMQTVIASVAFQYGHLAKRCPKFWLAAIHGDFLAMATELVNFGDRYPTRRRKEAEYLWREGYRQAHQPAEAL
ncbi:pesticin C-terminus-like muramidase [Shewanella surugensis]|uniref:Pesticin C-terminus-like muramidase n=1 Tax=Shewanella surugensis TaxID=212020 RepID=A0ABT0L750_9GAMM|nr:pesticin C-terminus-like muramidase [Shewanella surugensis]MCL1123527.1 pesticin C-terminus-like muramidase [Shewanella surugensis]